MLNKTKPELTPQQQEQADAKRLAKNQIISNTIKNTKERRKGMTVKVIDIKILGGKHMTYTQKTLLQKTLVGLKQLRNAALATEKPWEYDDKQTEIPVYNPATGETTMRDISYIGSSIRQRHIKQIGTDITNLSKAKAKGKKICKLKYKKKPGRTIILKQYKNKAAGETSGTWWFQNKARTRIKVQAIPGNLHVRGTEQIKPNMEIAGDAKMTLLADGWHLFVTVYEDTSDQPLKYEPGSKTMFDMGIKTAITYGNGSTTHVQVPIPDRLKKLQCGQKNKTPGSNNWKRQQQKINAEYQRYTYKKNDAANKEVAHIMSHEKIYCQDENISSWRKKKIKSGKRNKFSGSRKIHAGILGRVKESLVATAKVSDRVFILDKSVATTATCVCGVKTPHDPSKTVFVCSACKYTADRNVHAAKNMERLTLAGAPLKEGTFNYVAPALKPKPKSNKAKSRVGRTSTRVEGGTAAAPEGAIPMGAKSLGSAVSDNPLKLSGSGQASQSELCLDSKRP